MQRIGEVLQLSAQDLSNGQACGHSSELDRQVAFDELKPPPRYPDPSRDALLELGKRHEAAYLDHLRASGIEVTAIDVEAGDESAIAQTLRLMRDGAQTIYQGRLQHERWVGRADFLIRVDAPSELGPFGYEVIDTKLGAETRAGTILQLCLYSELVSHIQGEMPERMHVVTPRADFVPETYRVDDYAAYYRNARAGLLERLEQPRDNYPEPVEHCDVCRWWQRCDQRRRDDDHVSLVAGISRMQRADLAEHSIRSLQAFAEAPLSKPRRGSRQSLERVQKQAQIQLQGRQAGSLRYELIVPLEPKRGLNLLPEPNAGDVFLDLEGDSFIGRDGLEYLFGWGWTDGGQWHYHSVWARDAAEEKAAFDQLMIAIAARRAAYPELHIYHYAPYEPAALKRLASRYALHADLLDDLLRGERFVDLYRVVRQGVRVSVERYSIKELEPLFGFDRQVALRDVGAHKRSVDHEGNSNRSDEEVERVKRLFSRLLSAGSEYTDFEGTRGALTIKDILVVAPYNAQVNALSDALPGARVGTVDKFQGQEALVVIYSMATSSADDCPRGMDFLYDPHRLNVAVSRARALAIIVASPALLDPVVRSPKQMKLANALARFAELAGKAARPSRESNAAPT